MSKTPLLKTLIIASRPKTLGAALVPIFVSTALGFYHAGHTIPFSLSIFALLSVMFIQIGTNFINDAIDFKKGADTPARLGPTRITLEGFLTANQVLGIGFICFFIAILFGVPLVLAGGIPILILGAVSLLCGYLYTGGPFPLAYTGLGDIFVILFFGFGAICGMTYILLGEIIPDAIIASLQIGFLSTTLIAINNYRDHLQDRNVNKMTLAARWGGNFARGEVAFLLLATYLMNLYWYQKKLYFCASLPLLSVPIAILIFKQIFFFAPSKLHNKTLALAGIHLLLFGSLVSVGFIIHS